ncbi:MAG: hypothetical protein PHY45_01015 [Rhodocyclaceae bacterium]|nr:hypothetical protein [Rhodocyclaceae bacterium]
MFPILNILAALPWKLIAAGALTAVLFVGGCQYGENRITAEWDAEKTAAAQVVAKQAERVATVNAQQSTINQEISNEFQKAETAIAADRGHLLASVPHRVRNVSPSGAGTVPGVPAVARGTDAIPADAVPAAEQPEPNASCEKLADDAAQTTLMVVEFQKWYREQAAAFNAPIQAGDPAK